MIFETIFLIICGKLHDGGIEIIFRISNAFRLASKKNLYFNFLHKKQLKLSKNRQYISDFYGLQYDIHLMTHSFHLRATTI